MANNATCFLIYELRNWTRWSEPTQLLALSLPMLVFGWLIYKSWWKTRHAVVGRIYWRDLRWPLVAMTPWAITRVLSIIWQVFCYQA